MAETIHIGRKISKIRELRGMKQEALAALLGVSQQSISKIEQSADVEDLALDKIAVALGVTPEAIKNFSEDAVLNIINNTFTSHDTSTLNAINFQPTFNPIDKLVEVFEENKKLYEQLLASEREKVELLKNQGK
ncbi:helix-turn-helix transcriptional regulator [Mucilaginibacter sp.]|jgi:transcriptional regulator with XRE-family HTH domain|uniref:helix-turn-helix domain-containing protein n=1 Tax=Mucilaginibacter sp. TaxID=1882438 RepID=UPI002CE576B0|nr:helix-turn-helix transcriptional regulator [Mucilaginibacter sp.]HTI60117.1 helix-turn-helix transcriptional regulator [Mucilaginibacter sp.]